MRASYPTYKSTSIPWLPEMPEHWEQVPLCSLIKSKSIKKQSDKPLLSVYRDYGVILKDSRDDNHNKPGEDLSNYKYVGIGNLVLNKMKTWQGSLGVSDQEGIVSPAYIVCNVSPKVHGRYLHHLLRCHNYIYEYNRLSYGIRVDQWDMHFEDFKRIPIFLPPLPEQTAIANYLDAKTEQINSFIAKKEKLIALLKEQKQAVINELLEDKEWKWERRRLKYCVKSIVSGGTPSMDNKLFWHNGTIPWVSPKDMKQMFMNNTEMYVTELAVNSTVLKIIPSGSILIVVRSGILQRTIPIAFNSVPVTVNQDLKAITLNDRIIDPLYFYYFIKGFERKILSLCRKVVATVDSLEMPDLLNYKLIVPPIEKQRELTIKTKDSLQRIDKTIAQIETEIEKVKELKQSLIAEVVTGKIKVA